jgi:microcystin-dependent protein
MMFIGNIIAFTGLSVPSGYLVCDGSAVGREEYPELFAVIGTTYGSGDGLTTFNIPNLSGKVALGVSQNYIAGSTGGEETHILLDTETPSHLHNIPQHTHANTITAETPRLSHTVSTQPSFTYVRLNNAYKDWAANYAAYNGRTSKTMTRSTDLAIADHPATPCTITGGILDCPAFNTETAGEGLGHNNMMPYLAVTYLIKSGLPVPIEPGMAMYNGFMVATAGGGYISGKTV